MEQNKREQFIIRRIGGTTYKVKVVFNESGYETMEDKILRIVRNDMVTNDGTCGIINTKTAATPEKSRVAAFLVTNSLLVQCSIAVLLYFYECRPFHLFPSICDP